MKRIILPPGEKDNPRKVKRVKKIFKRLWPIGAIVAIFIGLAIFISSLSGPSTAATVVNLITTGTTLNSDDGRVNVLLLGMAGGRHAGATLTDTILIASYNLKAKKLYLISIPRDLWLPSLRMKANAVYQTGFEQKLDLENAKTVLGNVVGLEIHYGLRVDFGGFIEIVDVLGGIDVEVERGFDDVNFPVAGKEEDLCGYREEEKEFNEEEAKNLNIEPGKRSVFLSPTGEIATDSAEEDKGAKYFSCRYEHIHFDKGIMHMDGETALKFVRSRHGTNGEGSDFARSARQGKVIEAVKGKALSLETLTNPQKLAELIKTLGKSVDTDISIKDAAEFLKFLKELKQTFSIVLDDSPKTGLPEGRKSLLINPASSDYGAYVLISEDDDFTIIHDYVRSVFEEDAKKEQSSFSDEK